MGGGAWGWPHKGTSNQLADEAALSAEDNSRRIAEELQALGPDELGSRWGESQQAAPQPSAAPSGVVVGANPTPKVRKRPASRVVQRGSKQFDLEQMAPAKLVGSNAADVPADHWAEVEAMVLDGVRRARAENRPFGLIIGGNQSVELLGLLTLGDLEMALIAASEAMRDAMDAQKK